MVVKSCLQTKRKNCHVFSARLILVLSFLFGSFTAGHRQKRQDESGAVEPEFAHIIPNVSLSLGETLSLPCIVDNLGSYRVAWIRVESKTILTIHTHVITRNYRISLTHNDPRSWILNIKDLQESDRGGYMCQINTVPMKSQVGYVDIRDPSISTVKVQTVEDTITEAISEAPPDIIASESSSDLLVREGSNATLVCRAKGYPPPVIHWRREDGHAIYGTISQTASGVPETSYEGEELTIVRVSRLHMGAYLCVASNGILPPESRRILLQVHFPPMIWIPNQLIGASSGQDIAFECHTESYPMSINYWTRENGEMIVNKGRFSSTIKDMTYKVQMKLTIRNLRQQDFGKYKCFAKNSLGSTEGTIRLYEIPPSVDPTKLSPTSAMQSLDDEGISPLKQAIQENWQEMPNRNASDKKYGQIPQDNGRKVKQDNKSLHTSNSSSRGPLPLVSNLLLLTIFCKFLQFTMQERRS